MAVRPALASLITFVRDLIGEADAPDPDEGSGCADGLTDEQIQSALDGTRVKVRYELLDCDYDILPGGSIAYLEFRAEEFLDDDTKILDGAYNPLDKEGADVEEWDPLRGRFNFNVSRSVVLYAVGNRYDPYAVAADLLTKLAAVAKNDVDVSDMNNKTAASQAPQMMLALAAQYRLRARVCSIEFTRSDV